MSNLIQSLIQKVNGLTNAFNEQERNSKHIDELPIASTPLGGTEVITVVQNGTEKQTPISSIEGGGGGVDYDDTWILPEIEKRVEFKGQWVQASYNANDWVVSGSWMGVAKVDTTSPFPPEASGTPFWLLPATPTWEDLTLVGDIYQGLEFYGVQFNIVDGFRIWSNGVASETFRLFAYEVSGTGATTFLDFIDIGSNLPAGWNVVSLDQFGVLVPNQKYRLILETHADTNTTTLSDNWDWTPAEENPTAGNIGQTTTGLHINQVSGNATDQGAFLDNLVIGDDILLSESGDGARYNSYRIIGLLAKVGNVYNYEVTITATGDLLRDGRELDVDFTHKGVAVSTNYNRIQDHWSTIIDLLPDQIKGFVTQDPDVATSPTPGLNNNAYGLDLFYETYVLSDDWFYIGIGEGSTNQGGSGDIEIVDNLTTADATKALSANMGVDIQAQIDAVIALIPDTDDFMTKAAYAPNDPNKVDTAINADNLGGELPSKYDQSAHVANSEIHLSTPERAAITNMTAPPTGDEPFALKSDIDTEIDTTEVINENPAITGATQAGVNTHFEDNKAGLSEANEFGAYANLLDQTVFGKVIIKGASQSVDGRMDIYITEGEGYDTRGHIGYINALELVNSTISDINDVGEKAVVTKEYVAASHTIGEPIGSTKASNQLVISDSDYGDGSSAVTGTLYFIKP